MPNARYVMPPTGATTITTVGTLTTGATGAGFTIALSASTVTGTLADARLSSNVPLKDAANVWTGASNTFRNAVFMGTASSDSGALAFYNGANNYVVTFSQTVIPSANRDISLPDATGTVMLTSAIGVTVQAWDAQLDTWSTITPGTGVGTALAVNVGSAGAFVVNGGALGTPSSGTVTNLTGTASINSNGTVGATTPAAGTFTTLVAGSATSLLLGTAGSAVGSVGFRNATSGTITIQPTTGALGTITATLPAFTGTICVAATSTTTTQALFATGTAGAPAYRAIAAADLPSTLTSGTAITNAALTTPTLGTPASGTLTNCTGLPVAGGGTGVTAFPKFRVHKNGTAQTLTAGAQAAITFGTEEYDTGNEFASNGHTCSRTGYLHYDIQISMQGLIFDESAICILMDNGVEIRRWRVYGGYGSSTNNTNVFSGDIACTSGHVFTVEIYMSSAINRDVTGTATLTWWSGHYLI